MYFEILGAAAFLDVATLTTSGLKVNEMLLGSRYEPGETEGVIEAMGN
jgi:hypothetical protein